MARLVKFVIGALLLSVVGNAPVVKGAYDPILDTRNQWDKDHGRACNLGGVLYLGRSLRSVREKDKVFVNGPFLSFLFGDIRRPLSVVSVGGHSVDPGKIWEYDRSLNPLDSAYIGLSKYGWSVEGDDGFDFSLMPFLARGMQMMDDCFGPIVRNARPISYFQALQKCGGSKSPGYPWTFSGYKSRADCLNDFRFHMFMDEYLKAVDAGEVVSPRFSGSSKDEVRERSKVHNSKVRFYMGAPQEYFIFCTMLFGDMCGKLHESARFSTPMMIGLNKFSEWRLVWGMVTRFPNRLFFDFKNMDCTIRQVFFRLLYNWRGQILEGNAPGSASRVQTALGQLLSKTCVMPDGYEYYVPGGSPSGGLMTSDDATMVTTLCWFAFWCQWHPKGTWDQFNQVVSLVVYGDDVAVSFDDSMSEIFTIANIVSFFDRCKLTIEEVGFQFLSQRFVQFEQWIVPAPVDPYSRIAALVFMDKPQSVNEMFATALGQFIDSFWDPMCREVLWMWINYLIEVLGSTSSCPTRLHVASLYGVSVGVLNQHSAAPTMSIKTKNSKKVSAELSQAKQALGAASKRESKGVQTQSSAPSVKAAHKTESSTSKARSKAAGMSLSSHKARPAYESKRPPKVSVPESEFKKIERKAEHNAVNYVRSVEDPFMGKGIRIPDNSQIPSLTASLVSRVAFNTVAGSSFGWAAGCIVYPGIKNQCTCLSSIVNPDNTAVWNPRDNSQYSSMASVMAAYRVVSMGVRIVDAGAAMNRGLSMYCGNMAIYAAPGGATPLQSFSNIKTLNLMDTATCANECKMWWSPLVGGENPVFYSGSPQVTGSTWRNASYDSATLFDNCLVLYAYSNGATGLGTATPSDTMTVELCINIEYIPLESYNYIGDPISVISNVSALDEARSVADQSGSKKTGVVVKEESSFLDDVFKGIKKGWQFATEVADFVGPIFEGLFGASERHRIEQAHSIACLLGRPGLSPMYDRSGRAHARPQQLSTFLNEFKCNEEFVVHVLKHPEGYFPPPLGSDEDTAWESMSGTTIKPSSGSSRRL